MATNGKWKNENLPSVLFQLFGPVFLKSYSRVFSIRSASAFIGEGRHATISSQKYLVGAF